MSGIKIIGWGAIGFGILVIILPHLLNDLVAIFLILLGIGFLNFGRNVTKL